MLYLKDHFKDVDTPGVVLPPEVDMEIPVHKPTLNDVIHNAIGDNHDVRTIKDKNAHGSSEHVTLTEKLNIKHHSSVVTKLETRLIQISNSLNELIKWVSESKRRYI